MEDGSEPESDVEYLPDRFDSRGRPLSTSGLDAGWTERNGQFRRRPRNKGDWDVSGLWHIGGTDKEVVERVAGGVRDVIDGRTSLLGFVGGMMGGLEDGSSGRRNEKRKDKRAGGERLSWKDLLR